MRDAMCVRIYTGFEGGKYLSAIRTVVVQRAGYYYPPQIYGDG